MKRSWLTPFRFIYSLYAIILFVAIMLVIFPFVIIASSFGRIKGGNLIFRICGIWADLWFPLIGIIHQKIYDVPHSKSRQYIFVTNHISYLDAAMLPFAYRQPIRPLGKIELSRVPVFGYIYRNCIVTVDRSSPENRARSMRVMQSVISKGISVLVFPEGTFNTTGKAVKEFYDGAFRLAIETQTAIKPVLFLDSYSRMHYSGLFRMTPGRNRIVYMEEISVTGLTLADLPVLKEKVSAIMAERLTRLHAAWIKS